MRTSRRIEGASEEQGERLIRILSAATFLIFFQAYMIAPLIPKLADVFHVSAQTIGVAVPAYMIPYGAATLFYGIVSDRVGRRPIILGSLALFVALTTLTALARSGGELVFWRLLTGIGASGVVPIGLALMGDLFPYEKRGRPLGGFLARWPEGWPSARRSEFFSNQSSAGEASSWALAHWGWFA